jgi:hypothetical protein
MHIVIPLQHRRVWFTGEHLVGQDLGKRLSRAGIHNVELSNGALQERHVFLGAEQQLYRLPGDETSRLQGGDGGVCVPVCLVLGLDRVETAQRLVYEGDGGRLGVDEEDVVVAAHGAVEGGQLRGREVGAVLCSLEVRRLCEQESC